MVGEEVRAQRCSGEYDLKLGGLGNWSQLSVRVRVYQSPSSIALCVSGFSVGEGTAETKEVHRSNLWRMVRFCENKIECRRSLQLNYFGEYFKRDICVAGGASTCDNCSQLVRIIFYLSFIRSSRVS